jgi:trehalose 6-phosphate phosphatase
VLSDYDGTLAPVVAERERAVPQAGAVEALAGLAGKLGLVGVVSGRPLSFLARQLQGAAGVALFGLYGLERAAAPGGLVAEQAGGLSRWAAEMASLSRQAEANAPPGVEVEQKGLSIVFHARARPEALGWALDWAREQAAARELVAQPGRLSVELLPPAAAGGKARVVEEVASSLEALCFVGDDVGDLPAFEAVRRLRANGKAAIAVGVASPEQPARLEEVVDMIVDGPAGVVELLRSIAEDASL